ncbi:2-octaprenyl-6-methoxyphenyl hydroxylase [Kangiella sp. TOML190]|uniref:2-octaprenyl-6-methoxyphenyl hydroxylase n=1 Tax=Kangiella sp. TOML190 TaxID=2931351 RepID=UPI00203DFCA5|nr:2-octaprenyl-6-methoxyphenyl hydroxylase [Kangiella sp. TOML190]
MDATNGVNLESNYPLVIVGGGLVGATLAISLKAIGISPLVVEPFAIDSEQQPSFDDRSVALSLASLNALSELGLTQVLPFLNPIHHIHVSDQGHYGFTRIHAQDYGFDELGAVVENFRLGQALISSLTQHGIDYCCPARVTKIEQSKPENNANQALLTLVSEEQSYQVKTPLVILADGARSQLRESLAFEAKLTDFKAEAIVCNIQTQQPHQNRAFERFTNTGPLALLPLSSNRLSVVWSQPKAEAQALLSASVSDFGKALTDVFGARLGKVTRVGRRQSFPLVQLVTDNTIKGRCLLMGNSAQSLHPIAGQGLNLAIRDIMAFQAFVATKLASDPQADLGDYQWLNQYQQARQADRQHTVWITESLARLFANDSKLLSVSRNLLMKAVDIVPIAKETLAKNAMGFR